MRTNVVKFARRAGAKLTPDFGTKGDPSFGSPPSALNKFFILKRLACQKLGSHLVPKTGVTFGTKSWGQFCLIFMWFQATADWQWWSYLSGQVPSGRAVLRINLDETSICLWQSDRKGTVFVHKK